ncbi:multidrug efflux RND transporter permease subunit [Pseudomonas syringae]|uniref:multidrug efflux RND transporter permease subunit n=1 Tax=Pseudomonas syringae TaxID=317 RepID=UPI0011D10708|nr:multidrug efflux RND transporter permease subunit [Pseudomonas syringae]
MSAFFIDRPVLAWVVAILILLSGGFAATKLAVERYPNVSPPRVGIEASYPGASPDVVERTVTSVIERELNGIPDLLSFNSSSTEGGLEINVLLNPGTDTKLTAIEVQNRIKRVEERLPESVRRQGIKVEQSSESSLLFVTLNADNPNVDHIQLGDLAASLVRPALLRVNGVGQVDLWSPEYAMRIWPAVHKLSALGITTNELVSAVSLQNRRVPLGSIGTAPAPGNTVLTAPLALQEDLNTPQAFGEIQLRVNSDGSALRVSDVARVELGASNYDYPAFINGRHAAAMSIKLAPGANALATTDSIKTSLTALSAQFPPGVHFQTSFDSSAFVKLSIQKVGYTLLEAMALVFLVMWLFLRSLRATLIPILLVPVALAGTCGVMWVLGFSINVLTLFGMVLAIGILVDDAIVVVENVERIMREERLSPREATLKAMGQISGAIVAITLVLTTVFLPMAFVDGAMGAIYRQFSVAMAVPMALSAWLALTLTPALCTTLLKPISDHPVYDNSYRFHQSLSDAYLRALKVFMERPVRFMSLYGALAVLQVILFFNLPGGFLPNEDEGRFATVVLLPSGSTQGATREVINEVQDYLRQDANVASLFAVQGFSYFGDGQNAAMVWPSMIPWSQRNRPDQQIEAILTRFNAHFENGTVTQPKALIKGLRPPPINGLGKSAGVELQLQDRAGLGHDALIAAKDRLLLMAEKDPALANFEFSGQGDVPQLRVSIDRLKAQSMGVALDEINHTMETLYGSQYLGDFIINNQVRRILVQAESYDRQLPDSLLQAQVRNRYGEMVPLSAFVSMKWTRGALSLDHYNGFSSLAISGTPARGYSTTQAMESLAQLVTQLPVGIGYEWDGQSYQEQTSSKQAPLLFGLSILIVFLCLAALYESWSTPLTVVFAIPMGVLGTLLASTMRGLPDDLYFKVSVITIIGLSAKNSILIVEAVETLIRDGVSTHRALLDAARMRLRPIIMTSLAFMFGVLPLVFANGPGSVSQRAIGTGVFGGMLSATVLMLFFVPLLHSLIIRMRTRYSVRK